MARGAASSVAGQAIGPGIVVDCFKLDRILEIDADGRRARVQPGVVQAALNAAAAPHGLEFGPDTSTVDQATIAGMVGNNSSGSRSIVYGESKDKVLRVSAVLAGGEAAAFGACAGGDLAAGIGGPAGERLAAALAQVREQYREPIAGDFPQTRRCTSGYNLRELLAPEPNLGRLLAGSEGTLALFTELEVLLDPRPARRVGAAFTLPDPARALWTPTSAILETGPSAVEFLDLVPLRRAPNLAHVPAPGGAAGRRRRGAAHRRVPGERGGGARRPRAPARARRRAGGSADRSGSRSPRRSPRRRRFAAPSCRCSWARRARSARRRSSRTPRWRRSGSPASSTDLQRIVASHGTRASFTGHASAGCLHLRPMLDLKTASGVARMEELAAEIGRLVADYHGAFSGEHGCGRSRSWFLPELLGPGLYEAMVAVKDAFDPRRLLNPGVIVGGPPVGESLRFGADYRGDHGWKPRLSYAAEGGFGPAVEKCFGAGLCKKLTGTMCPPGAATRDEARSTRARANALQGVVCGAVPLAAIGESEFRDVLGTCVACKACKTECPAGVDMAALKVEWLAELRAREGVPLLARGIGDFRRLAALAAPVAPLVNGLGRTRAARLVTDRAGVAHERPLPALRPAAADAPSGGRPRRRRAAVRRPGRRAVRGLLHPVPGAGHRRGAGAAARRRRRAPRAAADAGCCGRTALSTGQIEKARAMARRALDGLHPLVAGGAEVALRRAVLPLDGARRLGAAAAARRARGGGRGRGRPALALVADLAAQGRLHFRAGGRALLHSHCHEKALGFAAATRAALAAVPGLEVEDPDAGCCGMSGVFGYEAEHYELSVAMAERALLPAVRAARPETAMLATGTSCRAQIGDLGGRAAVHPLEFLAGRLEG